jgi:hypothetical protein
MGSMLNRILYKAGMSLEAQKGTLTQEDAAGYVRSLMKNRKPAAIKQPAAAPFVYGGMNFRMFDDADTKQYYTEKTLSDPNQAATLQAATMGLPFTTPTQENVDRLDAQIAKAQQITAGLSFGGASGLSSKGLKDRGKEAQSSLRQLVKQRDELKAKLESMAKPAAAPEPNFRNMSQQTLDFYQAQKNNLRAGDYPSQQRIDALNDLIRKEGLNYGTFDANGTPAWNQESLDALIKRRDDMKAAFRRQVQPISDARAYSEPVAAGVQKFSSSIYSALEGGANFIEGLFDPENRDEGIFQPIHWLYQQDQAGRKITEQKLAEAQKGRGEGFKTYQQVGTAIGEALPNAALALATAGTSAAAELPALAGSAGLASTIRASLTTIAKNPTFKLTLAETYGNAYSSAKSSGATEDQAQAAAVLTGLINSLIEVSGGIETLPGALKNITAKTSKEKIAEIARDWVTSSLSEGKEEVVQGVIERLTNKLTYQPDAPLVSPTDTRAPFNLNTSAKEGIMGTVVGGLLGGGQTLIETAGNAVKTKQQNASTSINTNPATHTKADQKTIEEYTSSTDPSLLKFILESVAAKGQNSEEHDLLPVSERAGAEIKAILGFDPTGYKTIMESRQAEHIVIGHGLHGDADHTMKDINDVARMQYVINNYDKLYRGGKSRAYSTNKPNGFTGMADMIIFEKAVDGVYYLVEAVPDVKRRRSISIRHICRKTA